MVLEGIGSYGIVLSSPRIPIINEKYEDIINLDEVSKLLIYNKNKKYYPETYENIVKTYDNVIKLAKEYSHIFCDDNFILPIKGGYIDKNVFLSKFNNGEFGYGYEWISKSCEIHSILIELFSNKNEIFQVVYKKGTCINYDFNNFLLKMVDVLNSLEQCNNNGFYFDDLKYGNLIVHDDKIKIIDFEEPINLNQSEEEYLKIIVNSKFHCVMYFPYDTISNILLYEFIGCISEIGHLKNGNYFKLLHSSTIEYIDNVKYKIKSFDILIDLWKEYICEYMVDVDVYDLESIDFNELNGNVFNFENLFNLYDPKKMLNKKNIKINLNMFEESIQILHTSYMIKRQIDNSIKFDVNKIMEIVNKIFILNKKFIKLTKKTDKDVMSFLLLNTNICSYGFIFLDWLRINKSKVIDLENKNDIIKKIIEIVTNCCLNFIIVENKIHILDRNYINVKNINLYL